MKKVIFASSAGGHFAELMCLEKLFKEYEYLIVTEKTDSVAMLKQKYNIEFLKYGSRFYLFKYIFVVIYNIFKCLKIVLKFKPDTVVSTGAHTGGIMCYIAKMFGAKIIYIETLAKSKSLSVTGKNMYKKADVFFVQWEEMLEYFPKAKYIGRLM